MNILPSTTITGAVTGAVSSIVKLPGAPRNLTALCKFVSGGGGTSADAYLQTTFDRGATWMDIANWHFTATGSGVYNLTATTPQTTQKVPGDGSLTANTAVDGVLGPWFRVKYTTVGTFNAGTTLEVDIEGGLLPSQ